MAILDLKSQYGEGGFGHRGSFNAKLHRSWNERTAVAVGIENVLNWGGTDAPVTTFAAVTRRAQLREPGSAFDALHLTAGLGHGRFVRESRALRGETGLGVFGSAAVRVARPLEAFAEWTGQDLGVGLSLVPFRSIPLVITPTFQDFPGSNSRLLLGAGFGFTLY
ncbi:MAG TPA: hypothetical protein VFH27_08780 [Longimicrobiaceae bacterium]|nr:hypothetical protein [Longimicrobiaceae bacterium]